MQEDKPDKMSNSEAGKLGALAVNSDPVKKSEATKKAARTRMQANPHIFREIGRKGGLAKKNLKKNNKL